jgi:hypothetical protein
VEQKFSVLPGGTKAGLIFGLVLLFGWLVFAGVMVMVVTALGVGACSSSPACTTRATVALYGTLALHVIAAGAGFYAVFGTVAMRRRVLAMVVLAIVTPTLSFGASFFLVASSS